MNLTAYEPGPPISPPQELIDWLGQVRELPARARAVREEDGEFLKTSIRDYEALQRAMG
jgi:hypothetical protein